MSTRPSARRSQAGQWVLCDRFVDSSLAYQGGAGGLGIEAVRAINAFGIGDWFPDRTLVLALAEGGARARARDNEGSDRIGGRPDGLSPEGRPRLPPDRRARSRTGSGIVDASGDARARSPQRLLDATRGPAAMIARPGPGGRRSSPAAWATRHAAPCLAARRAARASARRFRRAPRRARAGRGRRAAGRPARARRRPTIIRSPGWSRPAAIPTCAGSSGWRTTRPASSRATSASTRSAGSASCSARRRALSPWRAVVIDAVDDLEASAANALAQDARGAAGQLPVPARQPCARAAAADDPLALPQAGLPAA